MSDEPNGDARDGDLWSAVVGQPDAVAALRAAAVAPVHAYLLVGPQGSGKKAAAIAFSAELLAQGLDSNEADRTRRLVRDRAHPSVTFVERVGASIVADQAREIVKRSALAPSEGSRQVFVLDEFHLVSVAAPMLLKAIEEPSASTVFVVLAEDVPDELVTIASRCVNVTFTPVPQAALLERLVEEGFAPEVAETAAVSAGGDLTRARLLASDPSLVDRREAWRSVPDRLDGTGAAACRIADDLLDRIDDVLAPLVERQSAEMAEFEAFNEQMDLQRPGELKKLDARHKREARRVRVDELRGGLATLMGRYRDAVVDRQGDSSVAAPSGSFESAAALVQGFVESLRFNPAEPLALRALLVQLPRL